MITAKLDNVLVEAEEGLDRTAPYSCSYCAYQMVLKAGAVVMPHFAHKPGSDCPFSVSEGKVHLAAKKHAVDRFRAEGYSVQPERSYGDRRIDVAVAIPTASGWMKVAVELQDSPITVAEMKKRMSIDKRNGYFGTLWLWIGKRHDRLVEGYDREIRIPEEMRWLDNRMGVGLYAFEAPGWNAKDVDSRWNPWRYRLLQPSMRDGGSWYEEGGIEASGSAYRPKTMKKIRSSEASWKLTAFKSKYHSADRPDWTIGMVNHVTYKAEKEAS